MTIRSQSIRQLIETEVFGVEAQQLTLSEWMAVFAQATANNNNPLVTAWNQYRWKSLVLLS